MTLRLLMCCAAVALGLVPAVAEAAPCRDQPCKGAAQPLQLNKFMKPAVARQHGKPAKAAASKPATSRSVTKASNGVAKKRTAHSTRRALAQRRAPALQAQAVQGTAAPAPVLTEAADAFATVPTVHVVSPDEINEIDLAAGPPTTDGSGRGIQLVASADYNAIDRLADEATQAQAAAEPPPRAVVQQPRSAPAEAGWFERLWAAIQGVLSGLAAMLGRLIG